MRASCALVAAAFAGLSLIAAERNPEGPVRLFDSKLTDYKITKTARAIKEGVLS